MNPVLTIVDDFLPDWQAVRDGVLNDGFGTVMVEEVKGNPKVPYENVNLVYTKQTPEFGRGLVDVFGRGITMFQQAFRLGFKDSQLHNLVHADHCCAALAAVCYLNPPEQCRGGTAFWRHKRHGWDMMPTQEQLDEAGYTLFEMSADWQDIEAWELVSLAGMKPNRLITYPTNAFHSRWPWEGFGDKEHPETARLIWCGFFDLV